MSSCEENEGTYRSGEGGAGRAWLSYLESGLRVGSEKELTIPELTYQN